MRIGPLEVTESGDELSMRYVSRSDTGPVLLGCIGTISFTVVLATFATRAIGTVIKPGVDNVLIWAVICLVLAIVAAVALTIVRRRSIVLASRDGRDHFVKGEPIPRTATVRVISSIQGFTACVSATKATKTGLYTFRWRRDAEDLAIAVASFLDLQYVSDPDPIIPPPKVPEDVWPPPPRPAPRHEE